MRMRTINEAAEELNVPRKRIADGIKDGRYPCMNWGRRRLVDVDALRKLLQHEELEGCYVSISEAAKAVGLSPDVLRRMARSGLIPHKIVNNRYKFRIKEIEASIRAQMEAEK